MVELAYFVSTRSQQCQKVFLVKKVTKWKTQPPMRRGRSRRRQTACLLHVVHYTRDEASKQALKRSRILLEPQQVRLRGIST
jgi:hypothetical protein